MESTDEEEAEHPLEIEYVVTYWEDVLAGVRNCNQRILLSGVAWFGPSEPRENRRYLG